MGAYYYYLKGAKWMLEWTNSPKRADKLSKFAVFKPSGEVIWSFLITFVHHFLRTQKKEQQTNNKHNDHE